MLSLRGKRTHVGQTQTTIEGYPAQQLGVYEGLAATAHFPDPFIWKLPVLADPTEQATKMGPQIIRDRSAIFGVQIDRIEQFAVDVQL